MAELELRPLGPGEFSEPAAPRSRYDDFGPRPGFAAPPPSALDRPGWLGVVDDGDLVGMVSWQWMTWGPNGASQSPVIGIHLTKAARGRGIGTAAQRALAELFFRHTAVNRIQAVTDTENAAEQRALERAGFRREATIRGAQWRDGAYRDTYLYAIVRADLDGEAPAAG